MKATNVLTIHKVKPNKNNVKIGPTSKNVKLSDNVINLIKTKRMVYLNQGYGKIPVLDKETWSDVVLPHIEAREKILFNNKNYAYGSFKDKKLNDNLRFVVDENNNGIAFALNDDRQHGVVIPIIDSRADLENAKEIPNEEQEKRVYNLFTHSNDQKIKQQIIELMDMCTPLLNDIEITYFNRKCQQKEDFDQTTTKTINNNINLNANKNTGAKSDEVQESHDQSPKNDVMFHNIKNEFKQELNKINISTTQEQKKNNKTKIKFNDDISDKSKNSNKPNYDENEKNDFNSDVSDKIENKTVFDKDSVLSEPEQPQIETNDGRQVIKFSNGLEISWRNKIEGDQKESIMITGKNKNGRCFYSDGYVNQVYNKKSNPREFEDNKQEEFKQLKKLIQKQQYSTLRVLANALNLENLDSNKKQDGCTIY